MDLFSRRVIGWSAVAGVQERTVPRGLVQREQAFPEAPGIDETSFQHRHEYATVISAGNQVLHVADGREVLY